MGFVIELQTTIFLKAIKRTDYFTIYYADFIITILLTELLNLFVKLVLSVAGLHCHKYERVFFSGIVHI